MEDLVKHIQKLRSEKGVPLHFRRTKKGLYIWYGHSLLASYTDLERARHAVDVAAKVHLAK
jgi:ribosomal protein L7Ae-like RNA K-turn-binding protein